MARFILISATAILLFVAPRVRADELKPEEFPVPGERMAELIELAADGNLTISKAVAPNAPLAARQVSVLRHVLTARKMALPGAKPTTGPAVGDYRSLVDIGSGDAYAADLCYRAVMAARSGNSDAADFLLEDNFISDFCSNEHRGYYRALYRQWHGDALNYRFLRWWAYHVSGPDYALGIITLMAAAQLLALPLLLKLRYAIKSGRRGRALIGLALAAVFVELVPLCWAAVSGPAWAFVYSVREAYPPDSAFVPFLSIIVFMICLRGFMSKGMRIVRGIALYLFGSILTFLGMLPAQLVFLVLRGYGKVSIVGGIVGYIFWSGILPILIYFLLLLRRERLRRRPI